MFYNICFSVDLTTWYPIEYIKENFVQLLIILIVGISIGFFLDKFILAKKNENQKQLSDLRNAQEETFRSDVDRFEKEKEDFQKLKLEHEKEYKSFKEKSQEKNDLYASVCSDKKFNGTEDDVDF